ncbi:related to ribosomal protein YmL40, mitochondrial [Cephalotrichum gorgonifer]|uniref:Related to ribosomal protein YmL40, mitochondrial n=1 Tax=Cephalotrichum gorgonifer TaxID=2041049 RepID=A0AAE8N1Y6_9PEZI|nr:related to ribosomal protein YmL40, mitochondrial [Cephalotrichum gorgonifer]
MEKLVQRTVKAERQVARRLKAQSRKSYRGDFRQRVRSVKGAVADFNANVANARRVRHEGWELGPVAPRRAVENGYGVATDQARTARSVADLLMRPFERERRCAWAGGSKYLNLAVGDRVVITEGKDKGNIDVIESISISTATVELKEFGKIVVKSPEWLAGKQVSGDQTYPEHSVGSLAIPISAIRLVHPLKDPVTGVTRDVIVRRLAHANVRRDRLTKAVEWDRYVVGLNVVLPWPEKPDPEAVQTEADTTREVVQEATFVPTLLRPPMPETLIHELRNRYSRFRTRHEPWYLEKKITEAQREKDDKRGVETMLTPQDEFNRKRRVERRSRGQPVLTEEALERIGAVMAKNQARA